MGSGHIQAAFNDQKQFVEVFMNMPDVFPRRAGATQVALGDREALGAKHGHEVNPRQVFYRTGQMANIVSARAARRMVLPQKSGQGNEA
jgi:hypothetical protein